MPLVRFGTRPGLRISIDADGRLAKETVAVQRYRCRDCGRVSSDTMDNADVVNAVADCAIRYGVSRAAVRLGIDSGTVSRMLGRWIAARDDGSSLNMPVVLAVTALRAAQPLRLLLSDPDTEGVVDVVDGVSGLRAHADECGVAPSLVSIDVDGVVAAAVREIWPSAEIAVSPSASRRAIYAAALSSFRGLVRAAVARGRNFRERPYLLRVADADLTDAQREELSGWSTPLRQFRAAVLLLIGSLDGSSSGGFSDTVGRVSGCLGRIAPGGALATLLSTWKDAMLSGVENRWLDGAWHCVEALRREVAARMPSAGLDVLRAVLVFSVPQEALSTPAPAFSVCLHHEARRRPIQEAMESLRVMVGDEKKR